MAVNIAKLIDLVSTAINVTKGIENEIKKELDTKKRKKFKKITKKVLADPSADGLAIYRDKLHKL